MPTGIIENISNQDKIIIGNPQITFFNTVFRRHTNFAIECIEQTFTQIPQYGKQTSAIISKNGDLLTNMFLQITLPALSNTPTKYYSYGVGNALIKSIQLKINGIIIDTLYSDWLNIWSELTTPEGHLNGYDEMVFNKSYTEKTSEFICYVPLYFWFNIHNGLALPLIALNYSEVQLIFTFDTLENVSENILLSSMNMNCRLFVDYIILDSEERTLFSQRNNEYLINQVQYNDFLIPAGATYYNAPLNFNLPVKSLYWVHSNGVAINTYGPLDYSNPNGFTLDTFTSAKITMSGSDRICERYASYFNIVQNFQHHTRAPRTDLIHTTYDDSYNILAGRFRNYIYTYSFSFNPELFQPCGNCNFSKLNNVQLQLKYTGANFNYARYLKIYALNNNILKIYNGMAGLAYSN